MAENNPPNPVAGESGTGRVAQQQNVVIDPTAQNAAATPTLHSNKKWLKFPSFSVKKARTLSMLKNSSLASMNAKSQRIGMTLQLSPTSDFFVVRQKIGSLQLLLFKREFVATSDNKLIDGGPANLAHRPGENPCKFFSRLEKLFNILHENYTSYWVKPERPAQLLAWKLFGGCTHHVC